MLDREFVNELPKPAFLNYEPKKPEITYEKVQKPNRKISYPPLLA